jgi:hypothetical protein
MKFRNRWMFCLFYIVLGADTALGDVFKCPDSNGSMIFTDKPCANGYRNANGEWMSMEQEAKREKEKRERERIEQERIALEQQEEAKQLAEKSRKESARVADSRSPSFEDVREANNFLSQLPPACSNSRANNLPDGTVSIRIICSGNNKSVDGLVEIKNGIVRRIR